MAHVRIEGLKKSYGPVVALQDINLDIPTGSFFTLLGPSGCGKTTLLRTIAGFHRQDHGSITIDGQVIDDIPVHRRDIGMVFQDYAIFPHLSVSRNIAFGLKQRKVARRDIDTRVRDMLAIVQLEAFAERMPHELSGGQQQRVGLARALITNPKVLLMDEPLSNLDAQLRIDLRRELRALQQSLGITTIYVTHDQEEALEMSDFVCVMHDGIIQHSAPPWDIYSAPRNRFVASFVGSNNFVPANLRQGRLQFCGITIDWPGDTADASDQTGAPYPGEGAMTVALRPEHIALTAGDDTAPAGFVDVPATLHSRSFAGRELRVIAETPDGQTLQVISEPSSTWLQAAPGSPLHLRIAREAFLFYASDDGRRIGPAASNSA